MTLLQFIITAGLIGFTILGILGEIEFEPDIKLLTQYNDGSIEDISNYFEK